LEVNSDGKLEVKNLKAGKYKLVLAYFRTINIEVFQGRRWGSENFILTEDLLC